RRERPQGMLDAVAELAEHLVGNVVRILGAEVNADALRANQPHDLLDALEERRRSIIEQQVRLVEQKDQLRFFEVAGFGKVLEQLRQQPQQQRRVQARLQHQLFGGKDADDAATGEVGAHEVAELERRLAEDFLAAVALETQQPALDRRDRLRAHQTVRARDLGPALGDERKQRAQVVEIEQQK